MFNKISKTANRIIYYIGLSIVLILVSAVILEGASFLVIKSDKNYIEDYKKLKFFEFEFFDTRFQSFPNASTDTVRLFVYEFFDVNKAHYHPYLSYEIDPFKGKYVNMFSGGRETYNPCAGHNSLKIWFFGGSSTFGYLARDDMTIPSWLSEELCKRGISANVTNYGQHGYQSTQDMIKFMLLLREEQPHIAVFYGGMNDIYSVFQTGVVDQPQNIEHRLAEFNSRDKFNIIHPLTKKSYAFKLMHRYFMPDKPSELEYNIEEKSQNIVDNYMNNVRLTKKIANQYGIPVIFAWQPTIWDRNATYGQEKYIIDNADLKLRDLTLGTNKIIKAYDDDILVLSDVFDAYPYMFYNDFVHTSEAGDHAIAINMAEAIAQNRSTELSAYTAE